MQHSSPGRIKSEMCLHVFNSEDTRMPLVCRNSLMVQKNPKMPDFSPTFLVALQWIAIDFSTERTTVLECSGNSLRYKSSAVCTRQCRGDGAVSMLTPLDRYNVITMSPV